MFCKEAVDYRFFAEEKEGLGREQITDGIKESYAKYKEKYADSEQAIKLLDELFSKIKFD